jgi:hypothetical protein
MSLDREILDRKSKKSKNKKKRKRFFGFSKTSLVFEQLIREIIKIFHQIRGIWQKIISFLKDLKMGYLPMHLSQFRKF